MTEDFWIIYLTEIKMYFIYKYIENQDKILITLNI